ncbi:MAG: glycosyltransferase family 39 protein [Anaerolineales bacterium]|nr:glycosyltransferase family 39 protein [Anaerolineales bacterium]
MQNKFRELPLYLLLITFLIFGLFTFKDYGLSWDEPLYYDYGKASQYAYSISARIDGTFDLEKSYGTSASDHVTRGPAYLLIGGLVESLLETAGLDMASAWHLTNFLTYLIGLTFFYFLTRLWLDPWPAALSTAFFATQPVLWNHAFINPKDMPFAVFFLISVFLGLRMIDSWGENPKGVQTILPGIFLGITTSIRFIAPYIVLLLFLYFITKKNWKTIWAFIPYGTTAIITMIALWPFLWPNPVERFLFTLQAMSETSANLKILFMGKALPAYDLPRRYFPTLLVATLTEPTWILFAIGAVTALYKSFKQKVDHAKLGIILAWFGIVITLLVIANPPNSDAYRHYLFMLPPVFIFAGFGINEIIKRINLHWLKYAVALLILAPAIYNNITLHPYQYAYYNSLIGGTKSAFREYETDYWLTCYKEAVEDFNTVAPQNARLFVKREPYIASYYTRTDITVLDYRTDLKTAKPGDFLLINSRTNEDIQTMKDASTYLEVGRNDATFCVIKQIP